MEGNAKNGRWLTDRSRYLDGLQHCQMYRYLKYHSANGYGMVRRSVSMPLATGVFVHQALADIMESARLLAALPPRDVALSAVNKAIGDYQRLVEKRGFLEVEPGSEADQIRKEQLSLVAGLVWGWYRVMLPDVLRDYEVIEVEQESELDLGKGVWKMVRADWVGRRKADGQLGNHDFKTMAMLSDSYVEEFKHSPQMALTTKALEVKYKEPVTHYVIHGLIKGTRRGEYNPSSGDYDGPKRQGSYLCYLYEKPANPPLNSPDFQPKWKYLGKDGRKHTLGRDYTKKPVWEVMDPRDWVYLLPEPFLWELFPTIGPYQRQTWMIEPYAEEVQAEELRWVQRLHRIFESGDDPAVIRQEIPRSWDCHRYNRPCEMMSACYGEEADPLGSGKYTLRRPHHQPEIDQMEERGLEVPAPEVEGDETE